MRLDNFDLNLLVAFNVLLEERNVTRAAQRLNVTQSAMSASLKRLRDALGDPILVQHGKTMIPTPHALALRPNVAAAVASLRKLIQPASAFDPATTSRTFRIAASDYIATVALAPLLSLLSVEAPGLRFDVTLPSENTAHRLGRGDFDLVLTPRQFLAPDHPAELLFEERHVVVGCRNNPLFARPLKAEDFIAAGHVAVRIDGRDTYIENELRRQGLSRRIEVYAPSFIQAPWLLPGTPRIALMHERLAAMMSPLLGLAMTDVPCAIPAMQEMMQFHAAHVGDAGLVWLRAQLRQLFSN